MWFHSQNVGELYTGTTRTAVDRLCFDFGYNEEFYQACAAYGVQ